MTSTQISEDKLNLTADVLVIGGGPAAAWAAWSAASSGAKVILVDKGYLGSSGATAPGGTNLLYIPPEPELREAAVQQRYVEGGYLSDPGWTHRVIDEVYQNLELIESWGYPFVRDEAGTPMRDHLQGPEYMRLMRRIVRKAGVQVIDHAPALELLVDSEGVGGARGIARQSGSTWRVEANAVVIATGGCAFLSKSLGTNVLTGDGLMMATEAGVSLSGMEFSRSYAPSAAFASVTRGRLLNWATYSKEDGTVIHSGGGGRAGDLLPRMLQHGPVYAVLDRADTPEKQAILRKSHAIFFLPYDRVGIDPFTQRFPLTLRYEGTVRGTGGIRLAGADCSTAVAGLYAAGDAASRERVMGGKSGGGAYNAAWAISSGSWAGKAAAKHALATSIKANRRILRPVGQYGLRHGNGASAENESGKSVADINLQEVIEGVQQEVFPLCINYFRSEEGLRQSLVRLSALWSQATLQQAENLRDQIRVREAVAMVMTARWMYTAALARRETRGMHTLAEYPEMNPLLNHHLTVSGFQNIVVGGGIE